MLKKFTINKKKFQGQFYNIIRDTLKNKYSELYPGQSVSVEYKRLSDDFTFFVHVEMKVISPMGGTCMQDIQVASYDNITAIKLFSNIPMEQYMEEYDDSRKNYRQQLKDQIDAIIMSYKLAGIEINSFDIDQGKVFIIFDKLDHFSTSNTIYYGFGYDTVTKEAMDRCVRQVRSTFKNKYGTKKAAI